MPILVWGGFLFPFITTKVLFFRLVIEAALVFYLILLWRYPRFRPRLNIVTGAVWLYVAVIFLTSLSGIDFGKSFMGTIERGEGFVTLLHFAVYFTILTGVFRTREQWYRYLLFALCTTAAVALYGLLQWVGAPGVIHSGEGRISGTIGNPAFFAAYIMFGIFVAVYLLSEQPPRIHRIGIWAILLFECVMFYQSQTRGAMLAVLVAVLIGAFHMLLFPPGVLRRKKTDRRRRLLAAAAIVFILGGGLAVFAARDSSFVESQAALYRLASISGSNITTESRLDAWGASFRGFADRFLIGYGYENYNVVFNKYFPPRIYKDEGSQIWFDRAHNIVFDVAVTSGVVGLLAYFGIFAAAAWVLWQNRGPLILALLLLAYFLQNWFVFDTQATYLMFFLLLAHIASLSPQTEESGAQWLRRVPAGVSAAAAAVLIALMPPAVYFFNVEPAMANFQGTTGIKAAAAGDAALSISSYQRALSHGTYMDTELRQQLAESTILILQSGQLSAPQTGDLREFTARQLRAAIAASPQDARIVLYLINFLNRTSALDSGGGADEALRLGATAVSLSPTRPQLYAEIGQAYFLKGDTETGLRQFEKAIELAPEPKAPRVNYLLAAITAGRDDLAAAAMESIRTRGLTLTMADYAAIANAYVGRGDKQNTLAAYLEAVKLAPDNVEIHAKLAVAYGDLCELDAMRREAARVVELVPAREAEAEAFVLEMEQKCSK